MPGLVNLVAALLLSTVAADESILGWHAPEALAADDACAADSVGCALSALQHLRDGRREQRTSAQEHAGLAGRARQGQLPDFGKLAGQVIAGARQAAEEITNATEEAAATALSRNPEVQNAVARAETAIKTASHKASGAAATIMDPMRTLAQELHLAVPNLTFSSANGTNVEQLEQQVHDEVARLETAAHTAAASSSDQVRAQLNKAADELLKAATAAQAKVDTAEKEATEAVAKNLGRQLDSMGPIMQKTLEDVVAKATPVRSAAPGGSASITTLIFAVLVLQATT